MNKIVPKTKLRKFREIFPENLIIISAAEELLADSIDINFFTRSIILSENILFTLEEN